jgi:hypothetical protein
MCESDMYYYIFVMSDDQGVNMNSERPATPEVISRGGSEPLADSRSRLEVEAR